MLPILIGSGRLDYVGANFWVATGAAHVSLCVIGCGGGKVKITTYCRIPHTTYRPGGVVHVERLV